MRPGEALPPLLVLAVRRLEPRKHLRPERMELCRRVIRQVRSPVFLRESLQDFVHCIAEFGQSGSAARPVERPQPEHVARVRRVGFLQKRPYLRHRQTARPDRERRRELGPRQRPVGGWSGQLLP